MLKISDNLANESTGLLCKLVPDDCRLAMLSKVVFNMGIGERIRSNSYYERRVSRSKTEQIRIALKCMYFTSLAPL